MKAKLFTDGGSRGNPGPAAYGYVLEAEDGHLLAAHGEAIGRALLARKASDITTATISEVIDHERIKTTEAKAKAVRGLADQMVTLAKRDSLHARRQVLSMMPDTEVVKKLFDTIAARFGDRHGGYTRIIRAGTRPGDRALMVVLELVDRPEAPKVKAKTDAKSEKVPKAEKAGRGDKGEAAAPAAKGKKKKAAAAAG